MWVFTAPAPRICERKADSCVPEREHLFQARIESIAQPIPKQVEAQYGDKYGTTRTECKPGVHLNPGHVRLQVPAPARCWGLGAQAQKAQRSFDDDGRGDTERAGDGNGSHAVGENVPEENPGVTLAQSVARTVGI